MTLVEAPGVRACSACGAGLPVSLLACPSCGSLVYSAELKSLAREAELAENASNVTRALGAWRKALELLPSSSAQHEKILAKVRALSAKVEAAPATAAQGTEAEPKKGKRGLAKWLAVGAASGALLLKFKAIPLFLLGKGKLLLLGLTQVKTLFSMAITVGVYAIAFGWWFALGLVVSIYIHEMGHVAALRLYGIPASAPMFVPGLGAFVRLKQRPATVREDARVGLAGPIWGAAAALVALALGKFMEVPVLVAIGCVGAMVNLFNLLPVWQLDGGRAFVALSRRQRGVAAAVCWALVLFGVDITLVLLAIMATVRAAVKDPAAPAVGDRGVLLTFVALTIGLTILMLSGGDLASLAPK